jgi:hypothetical protein
MSVALLRRTCPARRRKAAQIFKLGTFFRVTLTLGLGQKLGCPKKIIIPRGHSGPAMSFYAYNNPAMQHFRKSFRELRKKLA